MVCACSLGLMLILLKFEKEKVIGSILFMTEWGPYMIMSWGGAGEGVVWVEHFSNSDVSHTHTHTHKHTYIYIYIPINIRENWNLIMLLTHVLPADNNKI